jgi:hypothetical protein
MSMLVLIAASVVVISAWDEYYALRRKPTMHQMITSLRLRCHGEPLPVKPFRKVTLGEIVESSKK